MKRFQFDCQIVGVEKDSNTGESYVTAIASDTLEDNDNERMTEQALKDMCNCIRRAAKAGEPIEFLPSHRETFAIGEWVEADVSIEEKTVKAASGKTSVQTVYELYVRGRLFMDDARAVRLYKSVEECEDRFQLSIGGFINHDKPNAVLWEKRGDGTKRRAINRILLDHIAGTRKNWASVGRSRFQSAFAKGAEVFNCRMAEQIFKSLSEKDLANGNDDGLNSDSGNQENGEKDNDAQIIPLADTDATPTASTVTKTDGSPSFSLGATEESKAMGEEKDKPKVDLDRGEALAVCFKGRFEKYLSKGENNGEHDDIIESDIVALQMMSEELSEVVSETSKAGRKMNEGRLKRLRAAHTSLGEILDEVDPPSTEKDGEGSPEGDAKPEEKVAGKTEGGDKPEGDAKPEGEPKGEGEDEATEKGKGKGDASDEDKAMIDQIGAMFDSKLAGVKDVLQREFQGEIAALKSTLKSGIPGQSRQPGTEAPSDGVPPKKASNPDCFLAGHMNKAVRDAGLMRKTG